MKVLVTGAAGFVGRHVVRRLVSDGFEVTAFDRREATDLPVPLVAGDFLDPASIGAAVRGQDVVCHVGAIGDVYLAADDPALAAAVNVTGSARVAAAAREMGARVVYASTWEVYGPPRWEPLDEEHPCDPQHPYNITKLAGERLLLAADRLQGVPVIALRLGTVYGSGLRPNSVFRIFIDRAKRGEPIVIQGDGSQSRQFTHADDVAAAFSLASRSDLHGVALNIVSDQAVTIRRLAELVTARYPTEVRLGRPRPGDITPARVSSARAESQLGWTPGVSFEEGLAALMDDLESEED